MAETSQNERPPGITPALMGRILLSKEQVSELLQVETKTVDHLHRIGRLQGVKVGKELRWRPVWVLEFVEGLRQEETAG